MFCTLPDTRFVMAAQAKQKGTVSRVHFHSLSYHIVALTDRSVIRAELGWSGGADEVRVCARISLKIRA